MIIIIIVLIVIPILIIQEHVQVLSEEETMTLRDKLQHLIFRVPERDISVQYRYV